MADAGSQVGCIKGGLCLVPSTQGKTAWIRKKRVTLLWRNRQAAPSARWSRFISTALSHVDSMCPWSDGMNMWRFASVVFLIRISSLITRKTPNKSQLRDFLENNWPVSLKTVGVIKNKKIWETVTAKGAWGEMITNVIRYPTCNPGAEIYIYIR